MTELKFKDKFNRNVTLTAERIKHISFHIEVRNNINTIENVLKYPDIFSSDSEKNDVFYYQKYLKLEDLYLIVVVKINDNEGFIITIFKSKKPKK